jgi:hypothetical protein
MPSSYRSRLAPLPESTTFPVERTSRRPATVQAQARHANSRPLIVSAPRTRSGFVPAVFPIRSSPPAFPDGLDQGIPEIRRLRDQIDAGEAVDLRGESQDAVFLAEDQSEGYLRTYRPAGSS